MTFVTPWKLLTQLQRIVLQVALASVALVASFSQAAQTDVVLKGVQVSVPAGYERSERRGGGKEAVYYVRKGDGKAALAALLPQNPYDPGFLKTWFHDNTVAFLSITVRDRPAQMQSLSADEVQREFTRLLASQWGEYSFSLQGSDRDIRWFVNTTGAFVAVSTRVLGDKIVVVESMDLVHVLVAYKTASPKDNETAERLWKFFRRAANSDDAESLLRSARPEPR